MKTASLNNGRIKNKVRPKPADLLNQIGISFSFSCFHILAGEQYQKVITMEYYDYNQPIDPKMFTMDDIPDDVMRVDQTT